MQIPPAPFSSSSAGRPGRSCLPPSPAAAALALLVTLLPTPLRGQPARPYAEAPPPDRHVRAVRKARGVADSLRSAAGIPGLSVAVGADGEVAWAEAFGYADVEQRAPAWPSTKFRVGSVSKSLTSVAVGRLVEQGELDLDRPVRELVPYWPEKRWEVTTRQLAGHVAGVRHYRGEEFRSRERYPTVKAGIEIFADDTLLFEPGTEYSYSSYGWNLVSAVVEEASGQRFLVHMRRRVLEPLGLDATVADHPDSIVGHRTEFYRRNGDGRLENAPYVDNSYKWAGGGYLSTPSDLVRLGLAMLESLDPERDGILSPATVRTLWKSQRLAGGEETGYGIGWETRRPTDGQQGPRTVGHGGSSVGGSTELLIYPEYGVVVATTANLTDVDLSEATRHIGRLFLPDSAVARRRPDSVEARRPRAGAGMR